MSCWPPFVVVAGALAYWQFEAPAAARIIWGAGAALAAVYAGVRPLRRWIYLGWLYAAFPVGWTVSHVLLAATYYLVLTPIGLLARWLREDPLERKLDRDAATYWTERRRMREVRRYFRQF